MHFIAVFFSIRGISGDDLICLVAYSQTCLVLLVYFIMFCFSSPWYFSSLIASLLFFYFGSFCFALASKCTRTFFLSFSLNFRLPLLFSFSFSSFFAHFLFPVQMKWCCVLTLYALLMFQLTIFACSLIQLRWCRLCSIFTLA